MHRTPATVPVPGQTDTGSLSRQETPIYNLSAQCPDESRSWSSPLIHTWSCHEVQPSLGECLAFHTFSVFFFIHSQICSVNLFFTCSTTSMAALIAAKTWHLSFWKLGAQKLWKNGSQHPRLVTALVGRDPADSEARDEEQSPGALLWFHNQGPAFPCIVVKPST